MSMPGVLAGTLLTFIPAAGDYVNAELLGSDNTKMVGNVIESQFFRVPGRLPDCRRAVLHADGDHPRARLRLRAPFGTEELL
jgi:hypothetical protein